MGIGVRTATEDFPQPVPGDARRPVAANNRARDAQDHEEYPPPAAARRLGLPAGGYRRDNVAVPHDIGDTDSDDEEYDDGNGGGGGDRTAGPRRIGLRGGAAGATTSSRTETRPTSPPSRGHRSPLSRAGPDKQAGGGATAQGPEPRPLFRTPTGLSTKQMKRAQDFEVNLDGGAAGVPERRGQPAGPDGHHGAVPLHRAAAVVRVRGRGGGRAAGGAQGPRTVAQPQPGQAWLRTARGVS